MCAYFVSHYSALVYDYLKRTLVFHCYHDSVNWSLKLWMLVKIRTFYTRKFPCSVKKRPRVYSGQTHCERAIPSKTTVHLWPASWWWGWCFGPYVWVVSPKILVGIVREVLLTCRLEISIWYLFEVFKTRSLTFVFKWNYYCICIHFLVLLCQQLIAEKQSFYKLLYVQILIQNVTFSFFLSHPAFAKGCQELIYTCRWENTF